MIRYELLTGFNIKEYIYGIACLRIEIFREYPYLYNGNLKEERHYLQRYAEVPKACVLAVFDDENLVGAATGIPMNQEVEQLGAFACSHFSIDETYCVGEILLEPAYRNSGLGIGLITMMEEYVNSLRSYRNLACATVVRSDDHPQRPQEYVPIDRFLTRAGFGQFQDITTAFRWCEIDGVSSEHLMRLWIKRLSC